MLTRLSRALVGLAGLAALALFVSLSTRRVGYPLELGNIEGMMMDHIVRLTRGQPLYVPPTPAFVPLAYMPLYPAVVALLAKVFGLSFTLGRLVSGLAALGVAALAYGAVRRATGSIAFGLAGAGLFLMGQGVARGAYDIVRPDSLMLLLAFGGLMVLRLTAGTRGAIAAALLLALAFFTKQHALLFGLAALAHLALDDRRRLVPFGLTLALAMAAGYAALVMTMSPWFDFYVRDVPSHWSTFSRVRLVDYARFSLFGQLAIPTLAMTASLAIPETPWRGREGIWMWAAVGAIGSGLLATLDPYAYFHVLMPTFAGVAIAGPIALQRVGERLAGMGARARALVLTDLLALLAFLPLFYPMHDLVPHPHAPAARAALALRLRAVAGPVMTPSHGYITTSTGREMTWCILALDDVIRARGNRLLAGDPAYFDLQFESLRHGPRRPTLFTDQPLERLGDVSRPLWVSLAPHYRLADSLDVALSETLRPVAGNRDAPRYVYVPREEGP